MKVFSIDRKHINSLKTIEELQDYLPWLQPNSRKLMWTAYGSLHEILKPFCFNNNKTWGLDAKEVVVRKLIDPFNPLCMSEVSAYTGRTPFAIHTIFNLLMWEATKKDSKRVLLKRAIKSARQHGYIKWN